MIDALVTTPFDVLQLVLMLEPSAEALSLSATCPAKKKLLTSAAKNKTKPLFLLSFWQISKITFTSLFRRARVRK